MYWDEVDKLNWSVNVSIDCKVTGVSFLKRVLFILRFICMLQLYADRGVEGELLWGGGEEGEMAFWPVLFASVVIDCGLVLCIAIRPLVTGEQIGFVPAVVVLVMHGRGFCVVLEGATVSSAAVVGAKGACDGPGLLVSRETLFVGNGLITGMFALF